MHAFVLALLLLGTAEPLVIDTSKLAEDDGVSTTANGTTIKVVRRGETRHVYVERDGVKDEVTIEKIGDQLRVSSIRRGGHSYMLQPQRIIVDGVPIDPFIDDLLVKKKAKSRYYVCPFDDTIVRVPHADHEGTLECPVDGMTLVPRRAASPYLLLD